MQVTFYDKKTGVSFTMFNVLFVKRDTKKKHFTVHHIVENQMIITYFDIKKYEIRRVV